MLRKLTGLAIMGATACSVLAPSSIGRRAVSTISEDVNAVKERDPAATSTVEIITSYSGLHALWFHRLAHKLWLRQVPLLPRWLSQFSRLVTQIEIHPGAQIGHSLFIDHGSGVVIGETTEIGDNVTLYQGVTLGGTGKEHEDRHPKIRHGVMIGAGAKILGNIEVGHCARIAAGSVVIKPVPHNSTVAGVPAKVIGQAGCAEPSRTMDQMINAIGL